MGHDPAVLPPAVLFDMDGTLVDTEALWWQAAERVAATLGHELDHADLPDVLGRPVAHTADHLRRVSGTATPAAALAARLSAEFAARVRVGVVPRPGAVELLGLLGRHGVATGLVSASPRSIVDLVLPVLHPARFAVMVSADDTERTKPAPDPYLRAAGALGLPPSSCVAVEDSPIGVRSAQAAGCKVIAVPSLAPIRPGPGRVVLDTLERVGLPLLAAMAAAREAGPEGAAPA